MRSILGLLWQVLSWKRAGGKHGKVAAPERASPPAANGAEDVPGRPGARGAGLLWSVRAAGPPFVLRGVSSQVGSEYTEVGPCTLGGYWDIF